MDVAILILGIIFLIIIIIFLSLISYNMYKLSHINNEQQNIIKIIEDNNNKRFSNSIFMINVKNIFFRFNNYLINDILKKICKDAERDNFLVKCDEEIKNRQFSDVKIKQYDTKINEMWKIIITTIKKIETPFYHKYTNSEIDNMIKENISLNKFLKLDNELTGQVNLTSLMHNMYFQIIEIYIDIIKDMIDHITDDIELQKSLFNKFKYLIEGIIISFLGENFEDIKSMITSGTDEGTRDRLLTKFSETYTKFNEINIEDEFDKSVYRFWETPEYRNNMNDLEDKQKNLLQQTKKISRNYMRNRLDYEIPEKYNNNQISYKGEVAWLIGDKKVQVHSFRLYESAKPDNFTPETLPDFKDIHIMESSLDERAKMIIKDEKYLITAPELFAKSNSK